MSGVAFYASPAPEEKKEEVVPVQVQEQQAIEEVAVPQEEPAQEFIPTENIQEMDNKEEIVQTEQASKELEATSVPIETSLEHSGEDWKVGDSSIVEPVKAEAYYRNDVEAPKKDSMFSSKREKYAFAFFLIPIIIMSFVSMVHLVQFFAIANTTMNAWLLGIAFETASIATIVGLVLLRKIKKGTLWAILGLLYVLQLLGNTYAPFSMIDPSGASKLFEFFGLDSTTLGAKRFLAFVEGSILPTAVLLLTKLLSTYLGIGNNNKEIES